jgi:TolA-binding protein
MERYLERELKRVVYFAARWKVRQRELEEVQARMQQEKVETQLNQGIEDTAKTSAATTTQQQHGNNEKDEENPFADEIVFQDAMKLFLKNLNDEEV